MEAAYLYDFLSFPLAGVVNRHRHAEVFIGADCRLGELQVRAAGDLVKAGRDSTGSDLLVERGVTEAVSEAPYRDGAVKDVLQEEPIRTIAI